MANLTYYLERLNERYVKAREQYTQLFDDFDNIRKAQRELLSKRREYSAEGFKKRNEQLEKQLNDVKNKLRSIPTDFNAIVNSIRNDVKKEFSKKYGVNPGSVDLNAVALINSGALTDAEMQELAKQYDDNATMLKMIGGKLMQSENVQSQALGAVILEESRNAPHLETFDSLAYMATKALRVENDEGAVYSFDDSRTISDGVAEELYPKQFEECMKAGAEISSK